MGTVALAVSLSMFFVIGGGVLTLFMCIRHRKRQRRFFPGSQEAGVKEAERRSMLLTEQKHQQQEQLPSKNVAVVIGVRAGSVQSSVPLITAGSPGSLDEKEGALLSRADSGERGQQQPQPEQGDTHLAVKPSLKVPVAHANSNSSVGSGASRSSLRSLQACAEIVADRARRMASGEAMKSSDEKPPPGLAPVLTKSMVSTASESTLSPSMKDAIASEAYIQRARSISAVVAAKQQAAHELRLAKQTPANHGKASTLQVAATASRMASFARPKSRGLLKRERSLSLPVISFEANGACSFLLDEQSSDSDCGNKIANPYSQIGKPPGHPPPKRKPRKSLPCMVVPPAAAGVAQAEIWKVEEVSTRIAPMTGAVEIVDLIMSDPEGDFDSTEEDSLFVPSPIVARVEPRKQKGSSMSQIASQSRSVQPRRVSQGRPVSIQPRMLQAPQEATQTTGAALQPVAQESTVPQRGSRFKRSRRSSQKQRVRVVGRAVTFHSHSGPPQRPKPRAPSFPIAVPGPQERKMGNRKSSVVEVAANETPDDSSGPGGDTVDAASSCNNIATVILPKPKSVPSGDRGPVPANSPTSESDSGPAVAVAAPTVVSPISQHIHHAGTLPGMVTSQQRRRKREQSRKRVSTQVTTPSPDWPDSRLPVVITPATPDGEVAPEGGSSPFGDGTVAESPALCSSVLQSVQSNGTGRLTESPASIYSADQPVDASFCAKAQGYPYSPFTDCASSVNSGDRESPA